MKMSKLLALALVLLISVGTLAGSTIAWFTDSVTSSGNKIQAGELKVDIELLQENDNGEDEWVSLREYPDTKVFNYDRWEPGFTQVETLKIKNIGNLALEYELHVLPGADAVKNEETGESLAEAIDVYMAFGKKDPTSFSEISEANGWWKCDTLSEMIAAEKGFTQGVMLAKEEGKDAGLVEKGIMREECTCTIALHMQEEAGNEFQGLSLGTVGFKLTAKQYTKEEDSFGPNYDKNAESDSGMLEGNNNTFIVYNADGMEDAIAKIVSIEDNSPAVVSLAKDISTEDGAAIHSQAATTDITINGNGNTITSTASSVDAFQWEGGTIPAMSTMFSSADGSTVTVNDLSFSGTMSAVMLGHYQNATYNNYNTVLNNVNVVDAKVVSFSANVSPAVCVYGTAVLNDCNIYGTTLSELDTDPMWPVYDLAAVNYSDTTINGGKIGSIYAWNQAKVTVGSGSEVETIVIRGNMNTTKYGVTIKSGATVGSIDLSAITNKAKVNFNIEDGATVGKIVANGVEYASIADWQNA